MQILDLPSVVTGAVGDFDAVGSPILADVGVACRLVSGDLEAQGWIPLQDAARLAGMTDTGLVRNVERHTPTLVKRVADPVTKKVAVYIHRDAEKVQRGLRRREASAPPTTSGSVWPKNLSQTIEQLIEENRRLMAERDAAEREVRVKGELLDRFLPPQQGHGGGRLQQAQ